MKKLFCVLTVVCMLASLVCVSALAGPDEHDEQILVAAEPTATNAEPTGKITVWSGNVGRDFTTDNTMAVIDVDELTAAIRNDLAANGIPTKYEIEAVATYVSGPSGNASWGFFREGTPVYMALWADKGSNLTNATFSDETMLQEYVSASDTVLCLYSDNSGDVVNVQTLTLYAYRDTEPTATNVEPTLVGDANADGVINLKDVLVLRKYLADLPVELDLAAADVNRDKSVNMKDVLALRQILAYGNIYSEQNPLDYTVERVEWIGVGEVENFPEAAILRSPADVEALFAKSEKGKPQKTYDDAFFAEKFLVALRVGNGYIDLENPISGVFKGEAGSLVIHTNNYWAVSPWEVQDALLISLPLSELDTFHTVYEVRKTPQLIFETGEITGYEVALKGRYDV